MKQRILAGFLSGVLVFSQAVPLFAQEQGTAAVTEDKLISDEAISGDEEESLVQEYDDVPEDALYLSDEDLVPDEENELIYEETAEDGLSADNLQYSFIDEDKNDTPSLIEEEAADNEINEFPKAGAEFLEETMDGELFEPDKVSDAEDYWFDFSYENSSLVSTDGSRDFALEFSDSYAGLDFDYEIEARADTDIPEGDGWSFDRNRGVLTLDGPALYEAGIWNIHVRVTTISDGEELWETARDFFLREPWIDGYFYDENWFPGDWSYQVQDGEGMSIRVFDALFPEEDWQDFRILSLRGTVIDDDPYDSRDPVSIEYDGDGWNLRAVRPGTEEITISLEIYNEDGRSETKEISYFINVGYYRAFLNITSDTGSNWLRRGNTMTLTASIDAEQEDPDTGWRDEADTSDYEIEVDPQVEWIDDGWLEDNGMTWEEAAEKGRFWDCEILPDGRSIRLTSESDAPPMNVHFFVKAYDHNEADRWEVCGSDYYVAILDFSFDIETADAWDSDLPPGASAVIEPSLVLYEEGNPPKTIEDVSWRFEWYEGDGDEHGDDIPHMIITDADGKVLTHQTEEGVFGKPPFTIKRTATWNTDFRLTASWTDEEGYDQETERQFTLNRKNYDLGFITTGHKGQYNNTWFYQDEEVKVIPDRSRLDELISGGYPVEISTAYGSDYDEEGNLLPIIRYEPDEDGYRGDPLGEFTFEPGEFSEENGLTISSPERFNEIKEILKRQRNEYGFDEARMVMTLQASLNGIILADSDIWVHFEDSFYEMEDDDATVRTGSGFWYDGGRSTLYVQNSESGDGNDRDDRYGKYYDVTITDIQSENTNILRPVKEGNTWKILGVRPGSAEITYTFTGGPLGDTPDTHTTWLHVSDDTYWLILTDRNKDTGEDEDYFETLIGDTVPLKEDVWFISYDPIDGVRRELLDPERYTLRYDFDESYLSYDEESGMLTGRRRGDTWVGVDAAVFAEKAEESDQIWGTYKRFKVHIDTNRWELTFPEGNTIYAAPGERLSAEEIRKKLGAELMVYSLKNPDGVPAEITEDCLDWADAPASIEDDGHVLVIPEDVPDDPEQLDEEGCYPLTVWLRAVSNHAGNNGRVNVKIKKPKRKLFDDVTDPDLFYYEPIYWAVDHDITTGFADNTFRPMNNCNRAAVVTFLWRMAGRPAPQKAATFKDMTGNSDFDQAISWALEQGITTGWADNTFRPWTTCNRAAIVTFLWRYAGKPEPASRASFKDMTGNTDFDKAISWAAEKGITTGYDDGTFRPWNQCQRLAVVSFLYRYTH